MLLKLIKYFNFYLCLKICLSVLIFITQTPDYLIPNTSSLLQEKLKLSKTCIAFDVNLGCSGYVYGLSIIGSLLQNIPNGKALLLVGDISTQTISMQDKSTAPLFSDAGTATGLEFSLNHKIHFNLQIRRLPQRKFC